MIEVIGFDERFLRKETCQNCGSILQFTVPEIVVENKFNEWDRVNVETSYIICPTCNERVIL